MLKKVITYTDPFTDELVSKECYFNISKAEATEMAMIEGEGMDDRIKAIMASNDAAEILKEFKKIIALSYGERTEDGSFIKSPEISQRFLSSEAYSELFMEFVTKPDMAAEFIKGMLPKDLDSVVAQVEASTNSRTAQNDGQPAWLREGREPTDAEMKNITKPQLVALMQQRNNS